MEKIIGYEKVAVVKQQYGTYYYALFDDDVRAGDKVIVSGRASGEIQTVDKVITKQEADVVYEKGITAEVVCKVDTSKYDLRIAQRAEAGKIKKAMDAEIKKMQEVDKYEMYAAKSDIVAKLLEKYKELNDRASL